MHKYCDQLDCCEEAELCLRSNLLLIKLGMTAGSGSQAMDYSILVPGEGLMLVQRNGTSL